jgi:drug/metabolite transporter (DMT)-like permease
MTEAAVARPARSEWRSLAWGLLGVASFSLTLPATRAAVAHLDGTFVALGRCVGAAILAAGLLLILRERPPSLRHSGLLAVVALGVVLGFPFLTTLAMQRAPASHGAVVVGLLPIATAVGGVLLAREHPGFRFWLTAGTGAAAVLVYALLKAEGTFQPADALLGGAVVLAAIGYALGGRLARDLGGWRVICWALVLSLPVTSLAMFVVQPPVNWAAPLASWIGFGYVTIVSQLLGFFAWYRGLALGGIARVGQVQLLQLFLTLGASALFLGEHIDGLTLGFGAGIVILVGLSFRLRASSR